ncbi:Laccase [Termitomyces sp. T112]|nr:Laccase [Termitomyces sp. T112]
MSGIFFRLWALVCLGIATQAATITTKLDIVNKLIDPDLYPRSAVLANGTFPGPTIFGKKGDHFIINVTNSLTDERMLRATTIHWHGIFQNQTNWADGAAMVTQCPIVPDDFFVYDFDINQAGTYWYHSHYSTQYCDGLRGAIVIYDPNDPYIDEYDVDDESTLITLADWIHTASPTPLLSNHSLTTLINGHGRSLQVEVTLNTLSPLAIISVEPGKRYRFRVASLACDAPFNFTIHGHKMTIIETDGESTTPLVVDSLWIYAGQRYSVIVHANQTIGNYWIRADPLFPRGYPGFDNGRNSAILRYAGAPEADPETTDNSTQPLNEDDLNSIESPQPPGKPELGGADSVIKIKPTWDPKTSLFSINENPYTSPSVPVLLQILNGTFDADQLMPSGSVYKLKGNSSVELQLHGISKGGPHPFHLHGHSFWVIKNALSDKYNWVNPARRDTVPTGFDTNLTVIRFFTDNSGPWFLHCHIDWHIPLGLAIVFAEDPEGTLAHLKPPPPSYDKICPAFSNYTGDIAILGITEPKGHGA